MMRETRGLAQFAKEKQPSLGKRCVFGKHLYNHENKCACGHEKPKRKTKGKT
jgi:hypothetical protein